MMLSAFSLVTLIAGSRSRQTDQWKWQSDDKDIQYQIRDNQTIETREDEGAKSTIICRWSPICANMTSTGKYDYQDKRNGPEEGDYSYNAADDIEGRPFPWNENATIEEDDAELDEAI